MGSFKEKLKYQDIELYAEFIVVKGDCGNLVGYVTSSKLKLITVNTVNEINVKDNGTKESKLKKWETRFPNVFSGKIGKMKNFQIKLYIDKTVTPTQARPRNKPYHLRAAIETNIESKLQNDIIEEVFGEPTEWLSETVCTPKAGTDEVRVCTDMSMAN